MTAPDRPTPPAESPGRAQFALFARNFFKHPRMLGSIIPSSPFLVRRLLEHVDWASARVVVEYGPGVGTITREILRRLHPGATLLALETNADFVDYLGRALPDPRLQVVRASAESVRAALTRHALPAVDLVLTGIPFSTMPPSSRRRILADTQAALAPGGQVLIYQFSSRVLTDLRATFATVECDFEPLNVLPARLYYCRD